MVDLSPSFIGMLRAFLKPFHVEKCFTYLVLFALHNMVYFWNLCHVLLRSACDLFFVLLVEFWCFSAEKCIYLSLKLQKTFHMTAILHFVSCFLLFRFIQCITFLGSRTSRWWGSFRNRGEIISFDEKISDAEWKEMQISVPTLQMDPCIHFCCVNQWVPFI